VSLIGNFLSLWAAGSAACLIVLQWTKPGLGATLQCNVDLGAARRLTFLI
jgi:hypothetical protein